MDESISDLKNNIEKLRIALGDEIKASGKIGSVNVLRSSQELDRLIVVYMKFCENNSNK